MVGFFFLVCFYLHFHINFTANVAGATVSDNNICSLCVKQIIDCDCVSGPSACSSVSCTPGQIAKTGAETERHAETVKTLWIF